MTQSLRLRLTRKVPSGQPRSKGDRLNTGQSPDKMTRTRAQNSRMSWPTAPLDRFLLTQMDGTRDRNALVAAMVEGVESGRLKLEADDADAKDDAASETALRRRLDDHAAVLGGSGFLIA